MSRADAVKFLRKKISHAFDPALDLGEVSTGAIAVDYIVGGGFPRGKTSEVFGLESSGKSTLCMQACAKAQAQGLYPVFIDVERSLKLDHARNLGFDPEDDSKGLYLKPDTFEEMLTIVDKVATEGEADLVIVDSVPALVPDAVMKGDITEMGQFGQAARLFAGSLPRLIKTIERSKTALVFVNQLRANITTNQWQAKFEAKEKSYGGYALRYYSSMRVELKQKNKKARVRTMPSPTEVGKEIDVPVASLHEAINFKSKVGQPYQTMQFYIRYDPVQDLWGIDNLQTVISISAVKGLIDVKGGGSYVYTSLVDGKAHKLHGEDKLYDWFATHPNDVTAIRQQLHI